MRVLVLIAAFLLPQPALSGAWMRDEGTAFVSLNGTVDEQMRVDGTIYAEYGLRPKLTLGLKIDASMTNGRMADGKAFVFVRKPIQAGERAFKLAYEVGVGSTFGDMAKPVLRAGLSYGRGITIRKTSGWLAIDGTIEWAGDQGETTTKLDSTLGLSLSDRFQVMMQVFYAQTGSDNSTTLAPSVIWNATPDGPTRYQFGVEAKDGTLAVKLGVWRTF